MNSKAIILSLSLLAGSLLPLHADTMTVGYAGGQTCYGSPVGYGEGDNDWIEMAIYLPPSTVKTLRGCSFTGVNGSLNMAGNIKTVRIWLREELDGEDLAGFTLVPTQLNNVKKGVNSQKFTNPWEVPADYEGGLYVGFGHQIKDSNARGLSAFSTPLGEGCFFMRGADGKWNDYSSVGLACLEAVVEGDNLPDVNLKLARVSVPEVYVKADNEFKTDLYINNLGSKPVTAFDLKAEFTDGTTAVRRVDYEIAAGGLAAINVDIMPELSQSGNQSALFTIENIAEGDDCDPSDNAAQGAEFNSVGKAYTRYVLSEEFSTELCSSCPEVVKMLHEALAEPKYANVIQLAHHAGFNADFLTKPWHVAYTALYGPEGTFAPGLLADRAPRDANGTIVIYPMTKSDITNFWDIRLQTPALVNLEISAAYTDESRKAVRVTVKGEKSTPKLCEKPVINVVLSESGIPAIKQNNGWDGYVHDHVSRAVSASNYWGDDLNFEGDTYEYTCELPIDETWNQANMEIVAYIANLGEWNDSEVMNAAAVPLLSTAEAGVDDILGDSADEVVETIYYDPSGKVVTTPTKGLYLVRTRLASGATRTSKLLLP